MTKTIWSNQCIVVIFQLDHCLFLFFNGNKPKKKKKRIRANSKKYIIILSVIKKHKTRKNKRKKVDDEKEAAAAEKEIDDNDDEKTDDDEERGKDYHESRSNWLYLQNTARIAPTRAIQTTETADGTRAPACLKCNFANKNEKADDFMAVSMAMVLD